MNKEVCYYCEGSGYLMRTPKKSRKSLIKCSVCDGTAIEGITLEDFGDRLKLVGAFYSGKIEDAKREGVQSVIDYLKNEIATQDKRTAGAPKLKAHINLIERVVLLTVINALEEWQALKQKHLKEQSNDKPTTPPENEWVDEGGVLG